MGKDRKFSEVFGPERFKKALAETALCLDSKVDAEAT
jgi:hypothetical protein